MSATIASRATNMTYRRFSSLHQRNAQMEVNKALAYLRDPRLNARGRVISRKILITPTWFCYRSADKSIICEDFSGTDCDNYQHLRRLFREVVETTNDSSDIKVEASFTICLVKGLPVRNERIDVLMPSVSFKLAPAPRRASRRH